VYFGFPAGHDEMNFPLPFNSHCTMQIDENGLYLRFKGR
jgi:muramoyltetrapeptide carboxypeptidase LdcA involved in peptidoglycan recycling